MQLDSEGSDEQARSQMMPGEVNIVILMPWMLTVSWLELRVDWVLLD
jgi:hypothetical protein